jgi:hypothetical protein
MPVKLRSIAAALPLLAGACAMQPGPKTGAPIAIEREAVTYSTEACRGFCPVYSVRMTPEGEGVFTGEQHTAVTGERRFTVEPAVAARFIEHVDAVRPAGGDRRIEMGTADCGTVATDLPAINVRWDSNTGAAPQSLHLYLGCSADEARRVRAVLEAAPSLLPIAAFIGKR